MERKRITRKTERTPEEIRRHRQWREELQRTRPSLESLVATGDYEVSSQGDHLELMKLLAEIKKMREERSLTLTAVADKCGMDKGALSRLENGLNTNPTISTLEAVARAVGCSLKMTLKELVET